MDPRPLTLRQLSWMADARAKAEWARTSSIMALMAELKRNRKKQLTPFKPSDFDPTKREEKTTADDEGQTMTIAQLASLIPDAKYTPHEPPNQEPRTKH